MPVMPAPIPAAGAPPLVSALVGAAGERRYLTVMFCDLVGSTSISAKLDAEERRDLVGVYLDAASNAVTEMGGHVAKKLGDGLMALFGYPMAQENDAERAARAALSIQRALVEVNRNNAGSGKPALSARIGIETGPVVVDTGGEIYGDAPNTAAREPEPAYVGEALRLRARATSHVAARWPMPNPWFAHRIFPGAPKHVLHELESDVLGWHFWRTRTAPSCQYRETQKLAIRVQR